MKFSGMTTLTLLDYPGHTAITLFTYGCNFCCPFCHNASLVTKQNNQAITSDEVINFLNKRKNVIEGVCITGGEPTLHKDLRSFIELIKSMGFLVKLDTNGSNPALLEELLKANLLDYVAMDIKNCPEKYEATCGKTINFDDVKKSIDLIRRLAPNYEFRTTVVKQLHSQKEIDEIGKFMRNESNFYLQNFEDSGDLIQNGYSCVSPEVMKSYIKTLKEYGINAKIRGLD